jgi:aminoglycoside/choline kinase family phosphotransferase
VSHAQKGLVVATTEKRRADTAQARDRLEAYLLRSGLKRRSLAVVPLTGDASDRRYFRVIVRDAPSMVLALHPESFSYETLPFVRIASLLHAMPVPVPAIIDHADDLALLVLQDLGDVTLQAYLGAVEPAQHIRLYRQAVAVIEILQRRGADLASSTYPPYQVAFDSEKFLWELEFFTKHFLEGYRGLTIEPPMRDALLREWRNLAELLASEPRVLCHRDYHSRNLMLSAGDLYVIDFQDARMGPDTYDLASLLRDSYVDLTDEDAGELLDHFVALKREGCPAVATDDWEHTFRQRFEMMGLQRNLKALGTFGYQTTARSNPVYIQYIPRTLRYVSMALERQPQFGRLHELLSGLIGEMFQEEVRSSEYGIRTSEF